MSLRLKERVREIPQDENVKRKDSPPYCGCWSLADARSNERSHARGQQARMGSGDIKITQW
jgi:hypothetical protein